jgi:hypothetical protein
MDIDLARELAVLRLLEAVLDNNNNVDITATAASRTYNVVVEDATTLFELAICDAQRARSRQDFFEAIHRRFTAATDHVFGGEEGDTQKKKKKKKPPPQWYLLLFEQRDLLPPCLPNTASEAFSAHPPYSSAELDGLLNRERRYYHSDDAAAAPSSPPLPLPAFDAFHEQTWFAPDFLLRLPILDARRAFRTEPIYASVVHRIAAAVMRRIASSSYSSSSVPQHKKGSAPTPTPLPSWFSEQTERTTTVTGSRLVAVEGARVYAFAGMIPGVFDTPREITENDVEGWTRSGTSTFERGDDSLAYEYESRNHTSSPLRVCSACVEPGRGIEHIATRVFEWNEKQSRFTGGLFAHQLHARLREARDMGLGHVLVRSARVYEVFHVAMAVLSEITATARAELRIDQEIPLLAEDDDDPSVHTRLISWNAVHRGLLRTTQQRNGDSNDDDDGGGRRMFAMSVAAATLVPHYSGIELAVCRIWDSAEAREFVYDLILRNDTLDWTCDSSLFSWFFAGSHTIGRDPSVDNRDGYEPWHPTLDRQSLWPLTEYACGVLREVRQLVRLFETADHDGKTAFVECATARGMTLAAILRRAISPSTAPKQGRGKLPAYTRWRKAAERIVWLTRFLRNADSVPHVPSSTMWASTSIRNSCLLDYAGWDLVVVAPHHPPPPPSAWPAGYRRAIYLDDHVCREPYMRGDDAAWKTAADARVEVVFKAYAIHRDLWLLCNPRVDARTRAALVPLSAPITPNGVDQYRVTEPFLHHAFGCKKMPYYRAIFESNGAPGSLRGHREYVDILRHEHPRYECIQVVPATQQTYYLRANTKKAASPDVTGGIVRSR